MRSEDKINKALSVLDSLCVKAKTLVNKFIVVDMNRVLRNSFQSTQHSTDAAFNHANELTEEIEKLKEDKRECYQRGYTAGYDKAVDDAVEVVNEQAERPECWVIEGELKKLKEKTE